MRLLYTRKKHVALDFLKWPPVSPPHVLCCFHSNILYKWYPLFSLLLFFSGSYSVCCFSSCFHLPPSPLCYESERWIGVVGKQRSVCVMNESCPPRESEGTVVYTAGYRLMFSYSKVGVNVREDGGGRLSFEDEGRKKGRTNDNRRKGAFGWTG